MKMGHVFPLGVLVTLLSVSQVVLAFDFGDYLALTLGVSTSTVGICACLGCYARRRAMESI